MKPLRSYKQSSKGQIPATFAHISHFAGTKLKGKSVILNANEITLRITNTNHIL